MEPRQVRYVDTCATLVAAPKFYLALDLKSSLLYPILAQNLILKINLLMNNPLWRRL